MFRLVVAHVSVLCQRSGSWDISIGPRHTFIPFQTRLLPRWLVLFSCGYSAPHRYELYFVVYTWPVHASLVYSVTNKKRRQNIPLHYRVLLFGGATTWNGLCPSLLLCTKWRSGTKKQEISLKWGNTNQAGGISIESQTSHWDVSKPLSAANVRFHQQLTQYTNAIYKCKSTTLVQH